jgi:tRNA U34 2-thiouridine synthase MnmA/TrmU
MGSCLSCWLAAGMGARSSHPCHIHASRAQALYSDYLTAERVYWVAGEPPAALANGRGLECQVRCRHQQPLRDAIATLHNGKLKILFTTPQWALTPGQVRGRDCMLPSS